MGYILPCGKWIISLLTFPEYFNKNGLQNATINPSKNINLFRKYIAPMIGISMRFVGKNLSAKLFINTTKS